MLTVLSGHEGEIYTAEFDPVTASADQTARVWDAESGELLAVLQPHFAEVKARPLQPERSAHRDRVG